MVQQNSVYPPTGYVNHVEPETVAAPEPVVEPVAVAEPTQEGTAE